MPKGQIAHVAQSVEHMHGKHEVTGSIPVVGSDKWLNLFGRRWTQIFRIKKYLPRRHRDAKDTEKEEKLII